MSTKQMAQAAVKGRTVRVHIPGTETLHGYLVGMDDFHWLVAEPDLDVQGKAVVATHLVHKSAPRIMIDSTSLLSEEPDVIQAAIQEIGGSFFAYCANKILNRPSKSTQESTS